MSLPEVLLSTISYTAGHWYGRHDPLQFDLNAPYQRASVWTLDQRRALIKSLIIGLPVGSVIISKLPYREGGHHVRVIDGKQRIEALRSFAADEFTIPSSWLPDECGQFAADEVTYSQAGRFLDAMLTMARSLPALEWNGAREFLGRTAKGWRTRERTDAELLAAEAEIYLLVNGGGTAQTDADMARATAVAAGAL
jgi:hypothetical protein